MFEFKVAFKYLLFKKSRISSSLISLISIFIISIVVWLVLVFLSVTNGIEKNWLIKLTSLNAPIRIAPTNKYYSSYYYLIDNYSSLSDYSTKNIKEKLLSKSDPYDPCLDMELPHYFPEKENIDPIKKLYSILEILKKEQISFQDYELSAAMMKLALNRIKLDPFMQFKEEKINFLTQMTYITSLTENNPNLKALLLKPSNGDINQLISQTNKSYAPLQNGLPSSFLDENFFKKNLTSLLDNISIEKIKLDKGFLFNLDLFKNFSTLNAKALIQNNRATSIILTNKINSYKDLTDGKIFKEKNNYYFKTKNKKYAIFKNIYLGDSAIVDAKLDLTNLNNVYSLKDLQINIQGSIQKNLFKGSIPFHGVQISKVTLNENPQNNYFYSFDKNKKIKLPSQDNASGVLLPKNYRSSNVLIGDRGYLSYTSMTINSSQEMRIPIFVAGFYDPGVFPIGHKCIIASPQITKTINASTNNYYYDGTPINGIYVWIKNLKKAEVFKKIIQDKLDKENIASYFEVSTYKDFEFSKDLMQQFQSDRTLFTIIAIIILMAACSNIISMLVLLVNDKKKEIAILRAMGATSKSIALIFGFSGFTMGLISSIVGIFSAIFTLKHLDVIIKILSTLQGHNFFNTAFFGNKLPNDLSIEALFFVIIATPILALIAGLIPAIKASRVNSSSILRQ